MPADCAERAADIFLNGSTFRSTAAITCAQVGGAQKRRPYGSSSRCFQNVISTAFSLGYTVADTRCSASLGSLPDRPEACGLLFQDRGNLNQLWLRVRHSSAGHTWHDKPRSTSLSSRCASPFAFPTYGRLARFCRRDFHGAHAVMSGDIHSGARPTELRLQNRKPRYMAKVTGSCGRSPLPHYTSPPPSSVAARW